MSACMRGGALICITVHALQEVCDQAQEPHVVAEQEDVPAVVCGQSGMPLSLDPQPPQVLAIIALIIGLIVWSKTK